MVAKYILTGAMTNIYMHKHVKCVHISAKYELATAIILASMTVFRHTITDR